MVLGGASSAGAPSKPRVLPDITAGLLPSFTEGPKPERVGSQTALSPSPFLSLYIDLATEALGSRNALGH